MNGIRLDKASDATIVWVDLETTGLDVDTTLLLEVAAVGTRDDLTPVWEFQAVTQPDEPVRWDTLHPAVIEMHEANGLRASIDRGDGLPVDIVAEGLCTVIDQWCHGSERTKGLPVLAGSSVGGFDLPIMRRCLPAVVHERRLFRGGNRSIDVSSIKEVAHRWGWRDVMPSLEAPESDDKRHRALADVYATIAEAAHYRRWLTPVQPPALHGTVEDVERCGPECDLHVVRPGKLQCNGEDAACPDYDNCGNCGCNLLPWDQHMRVGTGVCQIVRRPS